MNPRKGLVLAMEEADAPLVQVEINAEKEIPAEIEADSAELAEDASEISDLNTAVESAEQDVETLQNINEEMEESVVQGEGLEPKAARIAEVAIESICIRLLGGYDGTVVPSMESFGGKSSRLTATRIAIENNDNIIVRAFNAIMEAIKKGFDAIVEFVKKFFVANERQLAQAEKMQAAIKGMEKEDPKETEFENSSLARASFDGQGLTSGKITEMLSKAGALLTYANAFAAGIGPVYKEADSALDSDQDSSAEYLKTVNAFQDGIVKKVSSAFTNVSDRGMESGDWAKGSGALVNGTMLIVSFKDKALSVDKRSREGEVNEDAANKTLSKDEMQKVLSEVTKLCQESKKLNSAIKELGNAKKQFDTLYKKAASKIGDKESQGFMERRETLKTIRTNLSSIGQSTTTLFKEIPLIVNTTNKAALAYVSKSMSQYPNFFSEAADAIKNAAGAAGGYVGNKAKQAGDVISGVGKSAAGKAADAWDGAKQYAGSKINSADKAVAGAYYGTKNKLKSAFAD